MQAGKKGSRPGYSNIPQASSCSFSSLCAHTPLLYHRPPATALCQKGWNQISGSQSHISFSFLMCGSWKSNKAKATRTHTKPHSSCLLRVPFLLSSYQYDSYLNSHTLFFHRTFPCLSFRFPSYTCSYSLYSLCFSSQLFLLPPPSPHIHLQSSSSSSVLPTPLSHIQAGRTQAGQITPSFHLS